MNKRWWILLYCSINNFATDFFAEEPSVLNERLLGTANECTGESGSCLNLSLYQFNGIISMNWWAAAAGALLAGAIADKFGNKWVLWTCATLLLIGPLVFTLGAYSSNMTTAFAVLMTGRLLTGLTLGASVVVTHRIKAGRFQYSHLALSYGIQIGVGRLGSALSFLILGAVVEEIGLKGSLWLAFGVTTIGAVCTLPLVYYDEGSENRDSDSGGLKQTWKSFKKFDAMFWMFAIVIFFYYGTVASFTANGPNYMNMFYGFSEATASYVIGQVYDLGLLSPLVGLLTDKYGGRQNWLSTAALFLFLGLLLLYLLPMAPPGLFIFIVGFAYSLFSPIVWSSIPLIVSQKAVGLATGTGKLFHFAGVGALTLGAGSILDSGQSSSRGSNGDMLSGGGSRGEGSSWGGLGWGWSGAGGGGNNRRSQNSGASWNEFYIFLVCTSAVCVLVALIILCLNRRGKRPLSKTEQERILEDDGNDDGDDGDDGGKEQNQERTPLTKGFASDSTSGFRTYGGTEGSTASFKRPAPILPRLITDTDIEKSS